MKVKLFLMMALAAILALVFAVPALAQPAGDTAPWDTFCSPWTWAWFKSGQWWYWQYFHWCWDPFNGWFRVWGNWGWW